MSPLKPSFIIDFLVNTCILDDDFLAARHVWWHRCGFTQPPNRTTSVWLQCKVSRYGDVRDVVGDLRLSELENLGMLLASRLRTTIWCKYHQFPKHSRTTFNWLSVCSCLFMLFFAGSRLILSCIWLLNLGCSADFSHKHRCLVVSKHQFCGQLGMIIMPQLGWKLPSGKLTVCELENHHQNNR